MAGAFPFLPTARDVLREGPAEDAGSADMSGPAGTGGSLCEACSTAVWVDEVDDEFEDDVCAVEEAITRT